MPTPIFPEPSGSDEFDDEREAPRDEQDPQRRKLLGFSDLSKAGTAAFLTEWLQLADDARVRLMEDLVDYVEESVDVNFNRVFRAVLTEPDPLPAVRQLAIEGLWEDDRQDVVQIMLDALTGDEDIDVRAAAAGSLVRFTALDHELDPAVRASLFDVLFETAGDTSENALVRRRAIESLGPLAHDRRVEQLMLAAYADDDQAIACGAVGAMGFSAESRWIPELERAMKSDDAEMRYVAAVAAGTIADSDLVPALASIVDDEDGEVRYAAIAAIGQIGGQGALRVLRNLRERDGEDDELVEAAFEEALLLTDPMYN
ncbi:MAG: HEAT repeat domain-containing protein [Thermomicrobiales bacterium]|nr:HEAT repeat domain-containing protein [Thermomicrobiales bacterium]